jgi:hypothetical protein
MAAPVVATGNRGNALPATARTSLVAATAPTSRVAVTARTSLAAATVPTSRVAVIGPSSRAAATGHSRPVPASTGLLTRERCRSGSIRAG